MIIIYCWFRHIYALLVLEWFNSSWMKRPENLIRNNGLNRIFFETLTLAHDQVQRELSVFGPIREI